VERSETTRVLAAVAKLIGETRTVVPGYGAGFGCVTTKEIAPLYAYTNTDLVEMRIGAGVTGMALPFDDGHLIALDSNCQRADQLFTIRHEFAHILAAEVEHALFLTSEDTMSFSERRADLFAVADLTPTRWVEWMRGGGRPWKHLTLEVKQAFRELTEGWSEQRLNDRAKLRVELYRKCGI
jgi:Zn-dependent peptidase ImmA (M78 family)